MAAVPARPGKSLLLLPSLGIVLVAGGLLLLGWLAYSWLKPAPAPYRYQLVEEGDVSKFDKLELQAWPDLTISKYELRVEGVDEPVALAHLARRGDTPPVLLEWENRGSEAIVALDSKVAELAALATAIAKYVPNDAVVLAWWDTARQLRLLTGRDTLFASHFGEPAIVPSHWRGRRGAIDRLEREFWAAPAAAEEERNFQRFADALAADAAEGAAMLRELAGPREAYLVVHVTDLYKLGLMRPDRLDMAYKDFPLSGNMHGQINSVKGWMHNHDYAAYTLHSLSGQAVRAYFLRDAKGGNTLLAQMLPLTTSRPLELLVVQLVYQHGGYWVYQIPSSAATASTLR